MDELIKKRGRVKAKLTRIGLFIDHSDPNTIKAVDVKIRMDMLPEIWSEFDTTQTQIECECQDNEVATQQKEQEDFESRFYSIKAKLILAHEQLSGLMVMSNHTLSNKPSHVKLPVIELPVFMGDYRQWTAFADLFRSVIHQNDALTPVQKLHYLKASVKGEAARLLNSIAVTEVNYLEAWKILTDRYSNRKQIIQSHLKSLFTQPKLTHESAGDMRKLLDVTVENVRALHALELPTEEWDCLLVFMTTERLDNATRRNWELTMGDNENISFDDLKEFIEKRCRALQASGSEKKNLTPTKSTGGQQSRYPSTTVSYIASTANCVKCKASHPLYRCEQFLKLSIEKRIEFVRSSSLCFNCMRVGHLASECKSSSCKQCSQRHNSLLHRESKHAQEKTAANTSPVTAHLTSQSKFTQILLATAIVQITDITGNPRQVRTLLDSGSQATFITEACVKQLGLKRHGTKVSIDGLGTTRVGVCRGIVHLCFSSMHSMYRGEVRALILHHVTGLLPFHPVDTTSLAKTVEYHQLELADPGYYQPGSVDLLLGADIYYDLLLSGRVKETHTSTVFQNTNLGWIISGPVETEASLPTTVSHLGLQELTLQLKTFWELEEITMKRQHTEEELACEEHFKGTYTRRKDGRFIVQLPFRKNVQKLGDTNTMARQRMLQVEKRLENQLEHKQNYHVFMKEYLELDHMEIIEHEETPKHSYYLPHHYVIKESSSTTKLRVVFDGTATPKDGSSLNEALMVGPTIQEDLLSIIMRFRLYKFAFIADITKMYRQVLMHPEHCDYQRIVYRDGPNMAMKNYRLKTVTYGTASAPFLATRCLIELANIGKHSHGQAATIIKRDFYVDDLISGADTLDEAQRIQIQLIELLASGGFELCKWASNNNELLTALPEHRRSQESVLKLAHSTIKTLGIHWQPESDQFVFRVTAGLTPVVTKRSVLSQVSKLFDPMGWLAPVVVRAKMMIQRLWLQGVEWDASLPSDIAEEWRQYYNELPLIEQINIPRHMIDDLSTGEHQLHGFCDSSESAYGAVVFIRSNGQFGPAVRLVCSKSRVAPLKRISLPRLELCGAVVLARLMNKVMSILSIKTERNFAWTDSTVVLSWLRKPPHQWKTFVANRVNEIQELLSPDQWRHISSGDNPADCLSRGQSPGQIRENHLWWFGPSWLIEDDSKWPSNAIGPDESAMKEGRDLNKIVHMATGSNPEMLTKYSSLNKLVRVTSYCQRFMRNCRLPRDKRIGGFLTTEELRTSLYCWIQRAQNHTFGKEIHNCISNELLPVKSKLVSLTPFVDDQGLLRVGGRLQNSNLTYNQKHPLILPHRHIVTELIISDIHLSNLHAGAQLMHSILRRNYWIIGIKESVRRIIHRCVRCFRHRVRTSQQLMGNLPQSRVEPARAFLRCGVDYAGPFILKLARGRGNRGTHKSYICVMICFTTKAIHIELVNDLTTSSFLAALKRFVSRRGRPTDIYSDCGTNFVGAERKLRELYQLLSSLGFNQQISDTLSTDGINWHFNPPASPHFGGLWEAGVKSIKFHLRRIVGSVALTYEEMYTVLTQIEACLNSRPLCSFSSDPHDLTVLTPGHFLVGDAMTAVPEHDVTHLTVNRLNRWELVQCLYQHFWKSWSKEYLSRLQQRPKWTSRVPNIAVGDLILLKEGDHSPLVWPMARVVQLHPGQDGLVRVVTIRTTNGILQRPITKCCVLPIGQNEPSDHTNYLTEINQAKD